MQGLFVEECGNAKTRVFDQPLLDGIHEDRVVAGISHRASVGRPGNLARPRHFSYAKSDEGLGVCRIESALCVLNLALPVPNPDKLRHLLLERHPAEQIRDPRVDRSIGLAIERRRVLRVDEIHGGSRQRQRADEKVDRPSRSATARAGLVSRRDRWARH